MVQPSEACTACALHRVKVTCCAGHDVRALLQHGKLGSSACCSALPTCAIACKQLVVIMCNMSASSEHADLNRDTGIMQMMSIPAWLLVCLLNWALTGK